MKSGSDRGALLAAANEDADLFAGHLVMRSYYSDSQPRREDAIPSSAPGSLLNEGLGSYSCYCEQPMSWGTRLFGLAGTTSIVGLVLVVALFTWTVAYEPARTTSQPLTVIELQPLATPPEPIRDVVPGLAQVEKRKAEPEPVTEPVPIPIVKLPAPNLSARVTQEPVKITDPGPAVPETTAPKSVAAPVANRLSNDARPNWEGAILAHLERFRRYPPRARAARQQGTVYVRFRMNRAGMVLSSVIVKTSGSLNLDQAALDTLQRAQPLPAIPAEMPDEVELTIPVEFLLRAHSS